jgi:hypothetical protein
MGTSIFLSRGMVRSKIPKSSTAAGHVRAIEAMSEYLMFLVAERRQMLPGLVLHSQLEDTRTTLEDIWHGPNKGNPTTTSAGHEDDKDKLARLVQQMRKPDRRSWLETEESRRLVLDAAEVDGALTSGSTRQKKEVFLVPMLDLIFNVWVDKLVYAAVRCSRESHAKQLSRGGELTTVLWIVIQHAGPFRIGEKKPDEKKPESTKEEPKEDGGEPYHLYPYPSPCPYPHPIPCSFPYPPQWPQAPAFPCPFPYPPQWPQHVPAPAPAPEEPAPMALPEDEPGILRQYLPYYKPDEAEGEELDPEDAEDSELPIRFVTLY